MRMRSMLPEERILVACGGIDTPDKALQLLADGANLLQLYTGLIYEGPSLVTRINDTLTRKLNDLGAPSLAHWQDHGT
jgi:dihydroorotate dehydrogenase